MRILLTGATGYIGGRLAPVLVERGHTVRCLVRSPDKLADVPWRDAVEVVEGDLDDEAGVRAALEGIDAAYYLVHSMGGTDDDFEEADRRAAASFRDAAAAAGVTRLVYLGGLGDEREELSRHLRSRHEVGRVLADGPVPVTELRAAIIIGSGSASFEMLRNLVEVLPVMVTPRWVDTRCQPVAIDDALAWLADAVDEPAAAGRILEIGGPDVLTYRELMDLYAEVAGLRRRAVVPVPLLSPRLSSLWIGLVTPMPPGLARPLVDSLVNEVVVRDRSIQAVLPRDAVPLRDAIRRALGRDHSSAAPRPTDPAWSGETVLEDVRCEETTATADALYRVVTGVGGSRGWYVARWMWEARGLIDQAFGGFGLRRGRRDPDELHVGDVLDFWMVEALEPGRLVRLRAEMRMPGEAWLEWRIAEGRLEQRARFHPRGLWGRAYWYALVPFHAVIFSRLVRRLVRAAEATPAATAGGAPRTAPRAAPRAPRR